MTKRYIPGMAKYSITSIEAPFGGPTGFDPQVYDPPLPAHVI
jgi:hypothetical protein